jgi:GntR family transcriptional regulator
MPEVPVYLRIAADLRARIASGELPTGAKLPTETELMRLYKVSRTLPKMAIQVLKSEGLVEGRQGSGVYVRRIRRLVREGHRKDMRHQPGSTSPFARDAARMGHQGTWEHRSKRSVALADIARRLAIEVNAPVMVTDYRFLADGAPIQLSTSWEPLEITAGTPVEWPEDGAVVGVVARMDAIGVMIDECVEKVTSRSALPEELTGLDLDLRGAHVLVIERTYYAAGRPVETANIVLPSNAYELTYRYPIDP